MFGLATAPQSGQRGSSPKARRLVKSICMSGGSPTQMSLLQGAVH
jgi:hypothetical protein